MNSVLITRQLSFLERLENASADMVFHHALYPTGGMGALAFLPEAGSRDLGEHLEEVSRVTQQARRILTDTGTFFLQVDPVIAPYHRLVADRIFGKERFATQIVLPSVYGPSSQFLTPDYDVVLVYGKTDAATLRAPQRPRTDWEIQQQFRHTDERGGLYQLLSLTTELPQTHLQYVWKGITPPEGRSWQFTEDVMEQLHAAGRIYIRADCSMAYLKSYLSEAPGIAVGYVWDDLRDAVLREKEEWPEEHIAAGAFRSGLEIMERMIEMGTDPGGRVVSTWDGSGTISTAASLRGRSWTVAVNHRLFAEALLARLDRYGLRHRSEIQVIGHEEVDDRSPRLNSVYTDYLMGLVGMGKPSFILGQPVAFEETLHVEFKEVEGDNPRNTIKATADQYAVAFLNREGGQIFWGIRNSDRVPVGISVNSQQRDDIRQLIVNKLDQLRPSLSPAEYRIEFHPVTNPDQSGSAPDRWVLELRVNPGDAKQLYATSAGTHYLKTDSGIIVLAGPALVAEVVRRISS
jgi:hypothetical protein